MQPLVSVIMNAQSDWSILQHTELTLSVLGIPNEVKILSVYRAPDALADYSKHAEKRGIAVIIAGASGSTPLPGMIAAHTLLPVLGVPISTPALNGLDSLLSMVQMPVGTAVGTLALDRNGAINAALLAAQILGNRHQKIRAAIQEYRSGQTKKMLDNPDPRKF